MRKNKKAFFLFTDRAITACLCLAIFCLPATKGGVETFVWLAIFLWLLKRGLGYRVEASGGLLPKTDLNKALGVFLAANVLSFIFSTNTGLSLRGLLGKELKFLVIFFMVVEVISSRRRLSSVLIALIASAGILLADAGVQLFRGIDFLRGNELSRLRASFSSANTFAGWLIVMIPLFLGLLVSDKPLGRKWRALVFLLAIVSAFCLLMTYSRGAWLGLAVGILLMAGDAFESSALRIKAFFLCGIISVSAIFLFLTSSIEFEVTTIGQFNFKLEQTVTERIKSLAEIGGGTMSVRVNLWKEALSIIEDFPVLGTGLNTYSRVAPNYKIVGYGGIYPHNSFLQMTAETGIVGLVAFLGVLFAFFKSGLRYLDQKKDPVVLGLLAGIVAFLVHSLVDNNLYALQLVVLFWFMLGLAVAMINLGSKTV